jgi:hypothetical protein
MTRRVGPALIPRLRTGVRPDPGKGWRQYLPLDTRSSIKPSNPMSPSIPQDIWVSAAMVISQGESTVTRSPVRLRQVIRRVRVS